MADFKNANLIRKEGGEKVYAQTDQGLRYVDNPDVLEGMGRTFEEVQNISQGKLENTIEEMGIGEPITQETLLSDTSPPDSMTDTGDTVNASDMQDFGGEPPPQTPTGRDDADSLATDAQSEGSKAENIAQETQERLKQWRETVGQLASSREETAESMQQNIQQLKDVMLGSGREAKLEEEREEMDVSEKLQKVNSQAQSVAELKGELSKIEEQERAEKERTEQRLASQGAINDAKREIERDYARKRARKSAELQSEAAVLSAYQDNLARAQSEVDKAVQAWTFDRQQKVSYLNTIVNQRSSWYNTLSQEEQQYMSRIRDVEQERYNREKQEMQQKMQLRLDAVQRGIDLGDVKDLSVEETTRRYEKNVMPEIRTEKEKQVSQLMMDYPTAPIKAGDDLTTALRKARQVGAEEKEMEKAIQQARLASIRGEDEEPDTGLSDYKLAQMAAEGVPNDVANTIQDYLNKGYGWEKILKGMKDRYGRQKAIDYAEGYNNIMGKSQQIINVGVPKIEEGAGLDFESMLEPEQETTPEPTEEEGSTPWYRKSPWSAAKDFLSR